MALIAEVVILDVGHGSCAVIVDGRGAMIIDTGRGDSLLRFLEQSKIQRIDDVLLSHADADHIGGLIGLRK